MVLVMWHDSVPTYYQATFPYHISQQSVISAGLGWRDNKFCHQVRPGVRHLTNNNCPVNAAPCRLLARGEESINMKSCVSPTSTTIRTERLLTWIIVTRPDQCPEGQKIVFQNTKCPKCGTQSACRFQTKPFFGNLGSLGGWTLGIINVQGGIPTPIYLYKGNPGNACYSVCPQHLWSSLWYQRRWNLWPYTRT